RSSPFSIVMWSITLRSPPWSLTKNPEIFGVPAPVTSSHMARLALVVMSQRPLKSESAARSGNAATKASRVRMVTPMYHRPAQRVALQISQLQISQCEKDRLFAPRLFEFALELFEAILFVLRLERLHEAEQHTAIARAAAQSFSKDLLAFGRTIRAHQRSAE